MTAPWLTIIGIGEDGYLAPVAAAALQRAELVAGGRRHLALADALIRGDRLAWPSPIDAALPALLARRGRPTAVLASGDPHCYGIGTRLAALVPPAEIQCHPGPSAFALARARLAWAAQDTATISFCGRPLEAVAPLLQPGARILALSATAETPHALAAALRERGFGPTIMHVMEALGGPNERVRSASADSLDWPDIHKLNLVALEVAAAANTVIPHLATGLPDALYEHDGQLTRREIRAITLSSLAPRRGELLWDVGGGAGSIGIEWMLRHPANRAVAIEREPARAARIASNAGRLGVPALQVVEGAAPDALEGLPAPHAVFLGGGAHRPEVIEHAWRALQPDGRLVANAVTVETEAALLAARTRFGGTLLRIALERLDSVGTMHAFRPAMTVTQWAVSKP
jgi:precorrin-6Y C5,15-methyltransferase (decarboxylating)